MTETAVPTILDTLAAAARERARVHREALSLEELKKQVLETRIRHLPPFAFEKALRTPGLSVIAEVKKASPSKGLIDPDFAYLDIARAYEKAGVQCISVLTEPTKFLGSDTFLKEIAGQVSVPLLRKDFVVDPYMIWEARFLGADAVLLIAGLLEDDELAEYAALARQLGLTALVECHDAGEIRRAVAAGARVIGVNNRDLKTFSVDTDNSRKLANLVPDQVLFVSESGMRDARDMQAAAQFADAVLVGEALMRSQDKAKKLMELKSLTGAD